jgi:predicted MFS family arabinose efflux permease
MRMPADSSLRLVAAGALAMAAAMGIGRFVYTPILPSMMDELGLSVQAAGWIASSNFVGYLLGAILAGGAWAQGRERAVILVSLLASTVLLAAMAVSGALVWLLAVRFLAGLVAAFVLIFASSAVMAGLAGSGRESLGHWNFGGVGLGIFASGLLMAGLHASGGGWQAAWLWSGAISLACLAGVGLLLGRGGRGSAAALREPRFVAGRAYWLLFAAYGLFGFAYIVTATFLVAIVRMGDADPSFDAVVWMATGLAGLPSVWLWGRLALRIGARPVFAIGCVVEAFGVMATVIVPGAAGPLIGGVLLGGTFIAITALGLQAARGLSGEAPRRWLALMTVAFSSGQILGPIAAAALAERTGDFTAASAMAAAALVLSAILALASHRVRAGV